MNLRADRLLNKTYLFQITSIMHFVKSENFVANHDPILKEYNVKQLYWKCRIYYFLSGFMDEIHILICRGIQGYFVNY